MAGKRQRPEQKIQRAVFQHFAARAAPGVFAFHPPNGGWRSPIEGAIFKGLGVKPGTPDVIAIKDGQVYALELKPPGGRVTLAQSETICAMEAAGAVCAVAYGLDDALAQLEAWGMLKGKAN